MNEATGGAEASECESMVHIFQNSSQVIFL